MSRDRRMYEGLSIAATKARAVKVQHPGLSLAGGRSPRPLPYVHVGRAAIRLRMAAERPAIPSPALRVSSMKTNR
jgi:hypothetical protein